MEIWKRREHGNMEWNIAAARCWTRREYGNEKAVAKRSGRGGARNVQYHWRRENAWADNSRGQRYETQRRKRRWANACAGLSSRAKNMEKQSSTRRPREFDLRTWPCPTRNAMRAPRCRSSSFGKDLPPTAGITHNDDGRRHLPSLLPLSIAMSPRNPDMVDMSSVFLSCLLYSTREDMRLATNSRGKGGGVSERREERIIGRKFASPHAQGH